MTADEVLAVIRERIKGWRDNTGSRAHVKWTEPSVILDDLDPDRIDAAGRLREELARDVDLAYQATTLRPPTQAEKDADRDGRNWGRKMADALLAKGWRK